MGSPEGSIMGSIPPRHLASPRARVLIYTLYIEVASPDPQIPRPPDPGHRAGGPDLQTLLPDLMARV